MSVRREKRRDPKSGAVREFWYIDFVFKHADGSKQRVREVSQVDTRRGAEERERQLRQELQSPTPRRKEVPTFSDFVSERWLPTYPAAAGNRATTIAEKRQHLRDHLVPFFGAMRLDEIKREALDRFFARLAATPKVSRRKSREPSDPPKVLSTKTRKNVRTTLRRILASAVEWEVIDKMPQFPKLKVLDSKFDFLSREESELLLSAARTREERVLLMFALHTGARASEQLAFQWGDIDQANNFVVFRRADVRGQVGPTKSGHERRVPLSPQLATALKSIRHLRGQLVFSRADGSALRIHQLHERLWGALRRAGLRRIRWHDLRHSFASQLAAFGAPLPQIQKWMGHSTITMTMRYAHLAPGGGRSHLDSLFGGSTPHAASA